MVTLIVAATALVFYLDLITPLGLTVWILSFIPLSLTFYVRWSMAPLVATAVFIALIGATSVLSDRDVSLGYALPNRLFFAGLLIVSAVFIRNAQRAFDRIRVSEEHPRPLAESSPDSDLVSAGDRIIHTNPAGEQMVGSSREQGLVGRAFADLIDPAEREGVCGRVRQTMEGARMHLSGVRMTRLDGSPLCADATPGESVRDGTPALRIVLRPAARGPRTG